ncbi:GTD-binding domain [Sesbania bispinosa]|nr:GTD-binding domain [Sesbania bispinosa]
MDFPSTFKFITQESELVAPRFRSHPKAPPLDRQPLKSHASANKGSVSEDGVLEEKEENLEDEMFDVMSLRKLVKIKRQRFHATCAEIKKGRVAASTAEKEAMAMILRLQSEKSSVEIRANQFGRMVFWILSKSNMRKMCNKIKFMGGKKQTLRRISADTWYDVISQSLQYTGAPNLLNAPEQAP